MNEEGIRVRWEQIYGDLIEYEYKQEDGIVKIIAKGRTKDCEIYANFFQDDEDFMEVMAQIDINSNSKEKQKKILSEYNHLIRSIII